MSSLTPPCLTLTIRAVAVGFQFPDPPRFGCYLLRPQIGRKAARLSFTNYRSSVIGSVAVLLASRPVLRPIRLSESGFTGGWDVRLVCLTIQKRVLPSQKEMLRLNSSEGVPGGAYRPTWAIVEDVEGQYVSAMTYIATGKAADGRPFLRYISLLRDGARAHGLPAEWLQLLDSVVPAE